MGEKNPNTPEKTSESFLFTSTLILTGSIMLLTATIWMIHLLENEKDEIMKRSKRFRILPPNWT
jgi:hypothetical protein